MMPARRNRVKMPAKERISKVVEKWYLLEPLYFSVWSLHSVKPLSRIKSIKAANGHIEYNPAFINSLTEQELYDVLCFEAMRIILKHPYTRKKPVTKIAYLASNITIQEHLKTKKLGFKSAEDFFGSDKYNKKYFEFYYVKIIENSQSVEKQSNKSDPPGQAGHDDKSMDDQSNKSDPSGQGGQDDESMDDQSNKSDPPGQGGQDDESMDDQSNKSDLSGQGGQDDVSLEDYSDEQKCGYENAAGWDKGEYFNKMVDDKIKEIQAANTWGTIPGEMQTMILANLKPKINYRTILKSFRASILSNKRRLTRMKPSRRYGFLYMGSRRDFTTKLLFAIDISGSVDDFALKNIFSIVNQFFKYGIEEISVICFDTEIKGEKMSFKKAKKEIKIIGRGGTDFNPVMDYIDKNRFYDGVIIFTDGYAPVPRKPKNRKTRILWLFDNEYHYKIHKGNLASSGKVAFIKES